MKKILSLLFCFLFVFTALVGCSKDETKTPGIDELPFEEYGGYRMLNVSGDFKSAAEGGISYNYAIESKMFQDNEKSATRTYTLFGETVTLEYSHSNFNPLGNDRSAYYSVLGKKLETRYNGNEQTEIRLTEDGKISYLWAYPFESHRFSAEMTNEEIGTLSKELLSTKFDFSRYTDFDCIRDDSILQYSLTFSRSYDGYRCADFLTVYILDGQILAIDQYPALNIPEALKTPSGEELNGAIDAYLDAYSTEKSFAYESFEIKQADINTFNGEFVLYVRFTAKRTDSFSDLFEILLLLE